MRKKRFVWLLWILVLAISACSPDNPRHFLRDTEAAALIQERWNEAAGVLINFGHVQSRNSNISSKTHTPTSEYAMYQDAARMRLIERENDLEAGRDFSATGANAAAIQNVQNSGLQSAAFFQCGEYRVETIISNSPLQIYGEKSAQYRAVLGTHVFELKPEFREVCLRHGESEIRERRFRALLKHDPMLGTWSVEASDAGPRDLEFDSANVPLMLAKLRADRRAQGQPPDSLEPNRSENEVSF